MTGSQSITVDHLRALLDTQDGASIIGLLGGAVTIIEADQRDNEDHRGALEVITRDELTERLGGDAGDDDLREVASALTTAMGHLGG